MLEPELAIDQVQGAKPTRAHNEFVKNMLRLTERRSWEVGEGSGSYASIEKFLKFSPSTSELDGDLPRTDECVDEIVTHTSSART